MNPVEYAVVLTTLPPAADAAGLAQKLIEERLAACVNVLPEMLSVYRWQDKIEREPERQLVIKTRMERVDTLRARIKELHPYEVPEFLVLAVTGGSDEYLNWILEETGGRR